MKLLLNSMSFSPGYLRNRLLPIMQCMKVIRSLKVAEGKMLDIGPLKPIEQH